MLNAEYIISNFMKNEWSKIHKDTVGFEELKFQVESLYFSALETD